MKSLPIIICIYFLILTNCFSQTTTKPQTVSWTALAGVTCVLVEAWGGGYNSAYLTLISGNVYPLNTGLGGGIAPIGGGNGTTQSQTQYFTVDPDPFVGVNYYRLNQFDFNGSSEYSEIRAVNILDDYYNMLSVFPNPSTGKTEVIFNSYSKGEAQIILFSPNGDIVLDSQVSVLKGGNIAKLDLSNIQKGVYIISIVTNHKVYTSKIIKQ